MKMKAIVMKEESVMNKWKERHGEIEIEEERKLIMNDNGITFYISAAHHGGGQSQWKQAMRGSEGSQPEKWRESRANNDSQPIAWKRNAKINVGAAGAASSSKGDAHIDMAEKAASSINASDMAGK